ncbi:MAG: lysylphosphatidylglycerol synthase transmembrane domain-containing protein [Bacteroidales bacterium]
MRPHLRTILVVALTVPLLVWFLWGANMGDVAAEIRHGRMDLLVLAIGTTMLTYALRAFRWQWLLRALGPTHFSTAFRTTVIGFAASFLLPARAGEVLRPYLLAREEHLNATAAFATIILERLLDMVAVLVLFAVFLLVFDPVRAGVDSALFEKIRWGGVIAGVAAAVLIGLIFVMAGHPEKFARAALRVEGLLPARLAHAIAGAVAKFLTGMGTVRQPARLAVTFLLSFPLWLSIALGIYLVTRAFHVDMPYTGSFAVMAILVIGVAMPTPGAVGGFHAMYRFAVTTFYAVPNDRAVSAGLVLHAISFVPVTLLGIVFMAREGLSLGRVRSLTKQVGEVQGEAP